MSNKLNKKLRKIHAISNIPTPSSPEKISCMALSQTASYFLTGHSTGNIYLVPIVDKKFKHRSAIIFSGNGNSVSSVQFVPSKSAKKIQFISAASNGQLSLWDIGKSTPLKTFDSEKKSLSIRINSNGNFAAISFIGAKQSNDQKGLFLLNIEKMEITTTHLTKHRIHSFSWAEINDEYVALSSKNYVQLFEIRFDAKKSIFLENFSQNSANFEEKTEILAKKNEKNGENNVEIIAVANRIACSSVAIVTVIENIKSTNLILVGSSDSSITLFKVENDNLFCIKTFYPFTQSIKCIKPLNKDKIICSEGETIAILNLKNEKIPTEISLPQSIKAIESDLQTEIFAASYSEKIGKNYATLFYYD